MTYTDQPREGLCMKCQRRTTLFRFSCAHLEAWSAGSHWLWLCTPDWSKAKLIDEACGKVCRELPISVGLDFNPFQPPIRTELDKALAYGPIGPIITSAPPKEA